MKKAHIPIIDLHSDLLSYLSHEEGRTPHHPLSRNSVQQMQQGGVKLQTLAIFGSERANHIEEAEQQVAHFQKLFTAYPMTFSRCQGTLDAHSEAIYLIPAIENASCFAKAEEPLEASLMRLEGMIEAIGSPLYISLTWNNENRFGGGDSAPGCGLKEDGKRLLEWMNGKKIAVDFSHASDRLAYDLLEWIDQQSLDIPVMASHSNFRAVANAARNLPEEIARALIKRKGVIGLNFFAPFIHPTDPSALVRHVEYALSIGGEDALCFGADFFCDTDFPSIANKYRGTPHTYYPEYSNSSCYPLVLEKLFERLGLKEETLLKIASQNALNFLKMG